MGKYTMKASWEKFFYTVSNWCPWVGVGVLFVRLFFFHDEPLFTTVPDAVLLMLAGLASLAGTALGVLLLWPWYKRVLFGNWPGRLLAALLSVGLLPAAALKKLNGGEPPMPVLHPGEAAKSGTVSPSLARARGGRGNSRGNKGLAQKIAEKAGIRIRSVNRILKEAAAAIRE